MLNQKVKTQLTSSLIVISVLGLVLWLYFSPSKPSYTSVNVKDIPHGKPYFLVSGSDTFIILRIPKELQEKQQPRITKKRKRVTDPPIKIQQSKEFRVFAVQSGYGDILLPERDWWKYVIPCGNLKYISEVYLHNDKEIPGVLKCEQSVSKVWENRLIYDLSGVTLSAGLANLYSPVFYVSGDQIRIGVSGSEDKK